MLVVNVIGSNNSNLVIRVRVKFKPVDTINGNGIMSTFIIMSFLSMHNINFCIRVNDIIIINTKTCVSVGPFVTSFLIPTFQLFNDSKCESFVP